MAAGRNIPGTFPPLKGVDIGDVGTALYVFSHSGDHLGHIPIPEDVITGCTFGNWDLKTIFITAGRSVYKAAVPITGFSVGHKLWDNTTVEVWDDELVVVPLVEEKWERKENEQCSEANMLREQVMLMQKEIALLNELVNTLNSSCTLKEEQQIKSASVPWRSDDPHMSRGEYRRAMELGVSMGKRPIDERGLSDVARDMRSYGYEYMRSNQGTLLIPDDEDEWRARGHRRDVRWEEDAGEKRRARVANEYEMSDWEARRWENEDTRREERIRTETLIRELREREKQQQEMAEMEMIRAQRMEKEKEKDQEEEDKIRLIKERMKRIEIEREKLEAERKEREAQEALDRREKERTQKETVSERIQKKIELEKDNNNKVKPAQPKSTFKSSFQQKNTEVIIPLPAKLTSSLIILLAVLFIPGGIGCTCERRAAFAAA